MLGSTTCASSSSGFCYHHSIEYNTSTIHKKEREVVNQSTLVRAGLRTTLPRRLILEILENSPQRHLGAEDIYRALQDSGEEIGIATVYRVLTQFEQSGLVLRHRFVSD